MRLALSLLSGLVVALCLNVSLSADEAPRLDADGEPLPPGAKFRLGTRQLRHLKEGKAVAWSADSKTLAFSRLRGDTQLISRETGKVVARLDRPAHDLSFSSDGRELLVASFAGVEAFDPTTLEKTRNYHHLTVSDLLTCSRKGKYLAGKQDYGDYSVVDRTTGEVVIKLQTTAEIGGLAFTHDEAFLLVGSLQPSVVVWDMAKRKVVKQWSDGPPGEETYIVHGPAVSPDGKRFAVGGGDVAVVSLDTMELQFRLAGDDPRDIFLQLEFAPDGKHLLAVSQEGPVYVWNVDEQSRKWKLHAGAWAVRDMALSPDGRRVAVCDAGNRIYIFDLETGKVLFDELPGHNSPVLSVAFSPDGATLATGATWDCANLWDARSGRHLHALRASATFLAWTGDGKKILTASQGGDKLKAWRVDSGEIDQEWAFDGDRRDFQTVAISGDGSRLTRKVRMRDERGGLNLWKISSFEFPSMVMLSERQGRGKIGPRLAVSLAGDLAVFDTESRIQIFGIDEQKTVAKLPVGPIVEILQFTPNDKFLITVERDNVVRAWDVKTQKEVHALKGHKRRVGAVAASANGRVFASADGQPMSDSDADVPHEIRFWDLTTGEHLASITGHDVDVRSLAFAPGGTLIVAGLQDATALVWDVPREVQK